MLMDMCVGMLILCGVHGGYVLGLRDLEGRILLELCLDKELCVLDI